jgi:hypothetical protein
MKYIPVFCFILFKVIFAQIDYAQYDSLLKETVINKTVDYKKLQQSRNILDNFTKQLEKVSPDSHPDLFQDRNSELAYWINAYNAFILKKIVDNYPVESIKDINFIGFTIWLDKNIIGGEKISFKSLEDDIIRDRYKDPRIHFAINCASISCPALVNRAYLPDQLDWQLDASTVAFINDSNNVWLNHQDQQIYLSAIFNWYESDFTDWLAAERQIEDPQLIDYLKIYYNVSIDSAWYEYKIEFLDYNWGLNDSP